MDESSRWDIKVTERRLAEFEVRLAAELSRLAVAKENEAKSLSDEVAQLQLIADATGAHGSRYGCSLDRFSDGPPRRAGPGRIGWGRMGQEGMKVGGLGSARGGRESLDLVDSSARGVCSEVATACVC